MNLRKYFSIIICLFTISATCSIYGANGVKSTKYITRTSDPIIITGEKLSLPAGTPIDKLRLYSVSERALKPIPFQIDERNSKGEYVFTFGKDKSKDEDKGLVDANDELVFMARDLGHKINGLKKPAGAEITLEIEIIDPVDGVAGWAYLFKFEQPPATSPVDYVSISKDGAKVTARNFKVTFGKDAPIGFDGLYMTTEGGGNGKNTIDRLKIRSNAVIKGLNIPFNKTEADFDSTMLAYIDGPVRVIRRTINYMYIFWKIAAPGSIVDNVFYCDSFEFPTEVKVPFDIERIFSALDFRVVTDGNKNMDGRIFLNSNNREGVVIDGKMSEKEKSLNLNPYKWSVIYGTKKGDTGAWMNRLEYDDKLEVLPFLYYMDDTKAKDGPEREPGQFGAVGYNISKMQTIKKGAWRLVSIMYDIPNYKPGDEAKYLNILDRPLEVKVKKVEK